MLRRGRIAQERSVAEESVSFLMRCINIASPRFGRTQLRVYFHRIAHEEDNNLVFLHGWLLLHNESSSEEQVPETID